MNGKKKLALILGAAAVVSAVSLAAFAGKKAPYSGTVKNDLGEPVPNVSVSDGRNVVKTDLQGKFALKGYRKSHFITVTVPAGYQTDSFYIPVKKDTESYDFVLNRSEITASAAHSFIQISDTEIGEGGAGEWLDDLKKLVADEKPAFLVHTGDICYEAGLKKHIEIMNTETMGCSVRYVIGNHDYVDGEYGEELFESLYGPVWYSFEVGKTHYVVTPFQNGADRRSAYSSKDRWRWLENDLANTASDMQVVIFNHTFSPAEDYVISFDGKKLDLKQHNLKAWVFGHYHYHYIYENYGVLNISTARPDCGGIDSSPSGSRIIRFDESGNISTQMHYYDMSLASETENAKWLTRVEGNPLFCDMLSDGEFVYTATADDDYPHNCGVYCINNSDGSVKWFYETENSVKNNVLISENRLIAVDCDGNVYCLDKTDGSELWKKKLELGNSLGTSSGAVIDGDIIYTGCARVVTALNINDGSVVWSVNRDKGENSPAEFVVTGDKLLVSSHWDSLTALDKNSGKELWRNNDTNLWFRSSTPAVIDGNRILVADDRAIITVSLDDGKIINKTTSDDFMLSSSGKPVIHNGIAYIPTAKQGVIAFDTQKGEVVRRYDVSESMIFTAPYVGKGAEIVEATPVISGDYLIFGAADGYLYKYNIQNGKSEKYFTGAPILGKAAVDESGITVALFDGRIVKF
ncbi:MAG: PQQ-binding-like beta-propeller repeat protein [Acutalibacteraceae bacterium]